MGKYKELARNTVIISIGTLLSKLVTFFMVRFYTGVLTPAEYGTGDLLITTVGLLTPFVSFGISEGVFRFLPEYPDAQKSVFSTGIYTVLAGSLIFGSLLPLLNLNSEVTKYSSLLAFLTIASGFHSVCSQYVRADGDTLLFAKQGLLNTLFVVSLNILLLTEFRLGVTGYVLSVGLADLFCTIYLVFKRRLWKLVTRFIDKALLKKMMLYSIPLIPTTAFWWITSVSDRYMIAAILGSRANGIYTVANKLPTVLTLLSGVLMQAWQYSAVSEAKNGMENQTRFYSNVWLALFSVLLLACSAMTALTKFEIQILADEEYFESWRYMPVLCGAMLFCAFTSFMGSVYTVTQKSSISLWTSLLGAGINIVLNAILIPSPLGLYGAAIATFASYFIIFLLRARNARRYIPFRLFKKTLFICMAALTVQVVFITLSLPAWQAVQIAAVGIVLVIGQKQIGRIFTVKKP